MKNQYVGDIGDFGKVLLLKHVAHCGFKLGVNWILTENDAGGDGKHRDYVDYRGRDCLCCSDRDVLEQMASFALKPRNLRTIRDLEQLIRGFSKGALFHPAIYPLGAPRSLRISLDDEAFSRLEAAEVVFFDPDNGLGGERGSSVKHVYLDDLQRYWQGGQSLLLYHHLSRNGKHTDQIEALKRNLEGHFSRSKVIPYAFRRGSARVYMLILQAGHLDRVRSHEQVDSVAPLLVSKSEWAKQRRLVRLSCTASHPWQKANYEQANHSPRH
jgi:hypothetical protein